MGLRGLVDGSIFSAGALLRVCRRAWRVSWEGRPFCVGWREYSRGRVLVKRTIRKRFNLSIGIAIHMLQSNYFGLTRLGRSILIRSEAQAARLDCATAIWQPHNRIEDQPH
jgi:hypothetical protein